MKNVGPGDDGVYAKQFGLEADIRAVEDVDGQSHRFASSDDTLVIVQVQTSLVIVGMLLLDEGVYVVLRCRLDVGVLLDVADATNVDGRFSPNIDECDDVLVTPAVFEKSFGDALLSFGQRAFLVSAKHDAIPGRKLMFRDARPDTGDHATRRRQVAHSP